MLEDRVSEIIREEVIEIVRGQLPEMFGSIKTVMFEYFDEHYTTSAENCRGSYISCNNGGERSGSSFLVSGLATSAYSNEPGAAVM